MKANEYKAWYRRNDPESARRGLDEYNRPFGERYERPPEYSFGSEAYPQYPERLDISEKQEAYQKGEDDKKQESKSESQKKDQAKKRTRASNVTRGAVQAVAAPVVGVVAGAAILVGGYSAIEAQKIPELPPIVATVECDWAEAYNSATITLTDENGTYIAELPATVSIKEVAATCTEAGARTYTATAIYDEQSYSKVHVETISPSGHTFDEGKIVVGENDTPMKVYECTHCHEKVSIAITIDENDE